MLERAWWFEFWHDGWALTVQPGDWEGSLARGHFLVLSSALIWIHSLTLLRTYTLFGPFCSLRTALGHFDGELPSMLDFDPQVACLLPPWEVLFTGWFCLFCSLPSAPLQAHSSESLLLMILTPRAVALGVLFLSELLFWQQIYYQCCDISPLAL